jgi:predicted Na+-dependent transporter
MTADQLLNLLFNGGVAVSIGATVASLGMTYTVSELMVPLRRFGLVALAVVVNCIVLPAAAWGICEALPLSDAEVAGVTLAAIGAGSAAALKGAQLSGKADLALAVAIVVVLQLVNILAVPFWAGEVVTGASLSSGKIIGNLLLLVLAPLAVGLAIRARYAKHAESWKDELVRVANLALVIALVAGISVNWDTIVALLGDWVLLASVLIIAVSLLAGRLTGGRDPKTATTMMLVSGFRFGSLGLIIIGTQLDGNADYLGPAIVFALAGFLLPVLLSVELGRRSGPESGKVAPAK